jgi:hypothetical protein
MATGTSHFGMRGGVKMFTVDGECFADHVCVAMALKAVRRFHGTCGCYAEKQGQDQVGQ